MPSLFNEYKSRKLVGVIVRACCTRNNSQSLIKKPYFRNGITCEINPGAEMKVMRIGMRSYFGQYRKRPGAACGVTQEEWTAGPGLES